VQIEDWGAMNVETPFAIRDVGATETVEQTVNIPYTTPTFLTTTTAEEGTLEPDYDDVQAFAAEGEDDQGQHTEKGFGHTFAEVTGMFDPDTIPEDAVLNPGAMLAYWSIRNAQAPVAAFDAEYSAPISSLHDVEFERTVAADGETIAFYRESGGEAAAEVQLDYGGDADCLFPFDSSLSEV